ncbi:MAG: hypothetical protein AB200_01005 [Parcubacteria bacterium C7867-005]|nr:MAG: hypothetical protein AB200_01005 [Parcubacteria bacterium C7867-005]
MFDKLLSFFDTRLALEIWDSALLFAPVWVPLLFILVWFDVWLSYKQREYIKSQGALLLEIKIPREISRSPVAMEIFLGNLYQTGVGSLIDVYLKGRVRPWFSLELISLGGAVHFYIWLHPKFKNVVESQLYAQYPNIEIHEAKDYALDVVHNPEKTSFGWFGQFALTKADAYPIKTYVDYGLHEDPKEEFKNDPIVPVLEFLGSLRRGEQAWIQILIQGHTKEGIKYGRFFPKSDWKPKIEKEIKDIVKKGVMKADDTKASSTLSLTKAQQDVIGAIERAAAKPAFDTMIRGAYMADKEIFNPNNIGGLLGSFKQFSSNALNGFRPGWSTGYDYPWQDFRGKKKLENEKKILEAYKRRSFFNPPFKNFKANPFILTTEELATLWHFPSSIVAATPTLTRIPSKKAEAPSNLPI